MIRLYHRILSLTVAIFFFSAITAQEMTVRGIVKGEIPHSSLLLISPMGCNRNDTLHLEALSDGTSSYMLTGKTQVSSDSLYQLMGIVEGRQMLQPLHIIPGEELSLRIEKGEWHCDDHADNQLLFTFNLERTRISRTLWEKGTGLSPDEITGLLGNYYRQATRLLGSCRCSTSTARYITLWAYTSLLSQYHNLTFITKKEDILQEITADSENLWPGGIGARPMEILDTPMALHFYESPQLITAALPSGTLMEKLQALKDAYHCEEVRERVADLLLERFISRFDYAHHFEEGLAVIRQATEKYHLDKRYTEQFLMRRYSSPGSPFPKDVILVDSTGKRIDFSVFQGKYVYIDLWASWCKPCIAEIPHLQQMEKDLRHREDIVFVSVSIDQNKKAWIRKMKELDLHGWQLLDEQGQLSKFLNINSIPSFLLYDKNGRLLQYKAPRPSSGEQLKKYLEDLIINS